jgi:hypothetical protein
MASINFYLEKRRDKNGRLKKQNVPILMFFSYDGKRLQMNTGERTDFEKWDFKQQKITDTIHQSGQINGTLTSFAGEVMSIYRNAKQLGIEPCNVYLRDKLRNRKIHPGQRFFDIYMKFIEEKNEKWSIHTFRKIKTNYTHLRDFSEKSGYSIDFERINEDFYSKYISYFCEKGHTNSTIVRNLNVLKWFLNWATWHGFNKNLYFRDFRFPWEHSYKTNPADQYLKWDELMSLYRSEIADTQLCETRDIFCFLSFTGLKHSQLKALNKNINFYNNINSFKPKVRNLKSTPFDKYIMEIQERYNQAGSGGNGLPDIRSVNINRLIKIAGRNAGLYQPVKIQICNGYEKLFRDIPKYKLLSTRLARNTFIFHSLRLGLPIQHILSVTGLKTLYGIRRFYNI